MMPIQTTQIINIQNTYKFIVIFLIFLIILQKTYKLNNFEKFTYITPQQSYATDKSGNPITKDQEQQRFGQSEYDKSILTDDNADVYQYEPSGDFYITSDAKEKIKLRNKLNKEQQLAKTLGKSYISFHPINEDIYPKAQGWWQDAITCEQSSANQIYCKPQNEWIWPY